VVQKFTVEVKTKANPSNLNPALKQHIYANSHKNVTAIKPLIKRVFVNYSKSTRRKKNKSKLKHIYHKTKLNYVRELLNYAKET